MRKRVFIADDDKDLMGILTERCRQIGLTVEGTSDGFDAGLALFFGANLKKRPAIIILDVKLPHEDGLSLCEELSRDDRFAKVPVVILTGQRDWCTIQRCRELGAHYVYKSGDVWATLKPLLEEFMGRGCPEFPTSVFNLIADEQCDSVTSGHSRNAVVNSAGSDESSHRVLVVDDDCLLSEVVKRRLAFYGMTVDRAFGGEDGFQKALASRPDVIITDYAMPDGDGAYLLRRLRENALTAAIPVIVVTGCDLSTRKSQVPGHSLKQDLLNLGAECVLRKPIDYDALLAEIRKHAVLGCRQVDSEHVPCP